MGATASSPSSEDTIGAALRTDPELVVSNFPNSVGLTATLSNTSDPRGRTIGYAEYGAPVSECRHIILFFHGTPGTRFFFSDLHSMHAASHGVRVIVPERPGYGLSPPVPKRSILDCANDVSALLHILGINFPVHVLGYSAGGPFALAFAHEYPTHCASLSIVSSLSPCARGVTNGMSLRDKAAYLTAMFTPAVIPSLIKVTIPTERRMVYDDHRDDWSPQDNAFFAQRHDVRRLFAKSTLELYSRKHGAAAEATDYTLMTRDWGFQLDNIQGAFPIWVYGGADDSKCTPAMFETLIRLLPAGRTHQFLAKGEGHLYFYKLFESKLFSDLGISRTDMKAVSPGGTFHPGQMLPNHAYQIH